MKRIKSFKGWNTRIQWNMRVKDKGFGMPHITVKSRVLREEVFRPSSCKSHPKGVQIEQPKRSRPGGEDSSTSIFSGTLTANLDCADTGGTCLTFFLTYSWRWNSRTRSAVLAVSSSKRNSCPKTASWMCGYSRSFFLSRISYNNFAATPNHKHLSQISRVPFKKWNLFNLFREIINLSS